MASFHGLGPRPGQCLQFRVAGGDRGAPPLLGAVGRRARHQTHRRRGPGAGHRAVCRFQLGEVLQLRRRRRQANCDRPWRRLSARTAQYNGDQGCTILPRGDTGIHFTPVPVPRNLPDAAGSRGRGRRDATTPTRGVNGDGWPPRSTGAWRRRNTTLARSSWCIAARSSANVMRRAGRKTRRRSAGPPARALRRRWSASA